MSKAAVWRGILTARRLGDVLGLGEAGVVAVLKNGDVVIMNNLATHKVQGVSEAIESVGIRLISSGSIPRRLQGKLERWGTEIPRPFAAGMVYWLQHRKFLKPKCI